MYNEILKISEIIGEVDENGIGIRFYEGYPLIYLSELDDIVGDEEAGA